MISDICGGLDLLLKEHAGVIALLERIGSGLAREATGRLVSYHFAVGGDI
jgi:hypothetical protein